MSSVPFTVPYVHADLADVEGVARLEADGLVLEFRTVDGFVGLVKSRPTVVRLTTDDLESVQLRRGWFSDTLAIAARSMASLESIPGANGVLIDLKCRRKYRKAAESISSALCLRIADKQLEELRRRPTSG